METKCTFRKIPSNERRTMNLADAKRTRHEWGKIVEAMSDPSFELDTEEFSEILRVLNAMERAGIELDPGLKALALVLARQVIGTDADSDNDVSVDDGQEADRYREHEPTCIDYGPELSVDDGRESWTDTEPLAVES